MITEDYWRCCKIIVNQVASVISKDGSQSSLKMNPFWVQGWTFSFPPSLFLLLLYNIAEMDTAPHEFLCKILSCQPLLCRQGLLGKMRVSLHSSLADILRWKGSMSNWPTESKSSCWLLTPKRFGVPLRSDSHLGSKENDSVFVDRIANCSRYLFS